MNRMRQAAAFPVAAARGATYILMPCRSMEIRDA